MSKLLTRKPQALFLLLSTLVEMTQELSFPFLVSRDYTYKQALGITMSTELTSTGRPYHFEDKSSASWGSKDPSSRKKMSVPFDFRKLDFMCHPDHNTGDFRTEKSKTAGMVSNSNEVMSSPYEVDLYYGIEATDPENPDLQLSGPGIPHCYQICEKEWDRDQVVKFSSLVNRGYGYRMYLDDLPSATVLGDKTYYDTHIPLGYIRWREKPSEDGDGLIHGIVPDPSKM